VLDAIPSHVAVLAPSGVIRRANAAWRLLAHDLAGNGRCRIAIGDNYLDAHDALAHRGSAGSAAAAAGIRQVMSGALDRFQVELTCPELTLAQPCLVQITPLASGVPGAVVTKQTLLAAHLCESREQLRLQTAALDATANAIVIADISGTIIWANPAFTRLTGFPVSYAAGRRPAELLKSGRHEPEFYRRMWRTILAGEIWQGEVVNRRMDGSLYTEDMTITPVTNESGVVTHFIAVKQDITQRKQLEEQFRQAQKMESIGRLAGGVAHDFNNQLSVILGHTDIALESLDPSHPVRDDLEAVRQAARRSSDLTRQLLTFARKKSVSPRVLDLNERVHASLRMLQRLIGENIRLDWTPAEPLWPVRADPTSIDQILTNLCVNARDAIPDVGTIGITTANVLLQPDDCAGVPDAAPGAYVLLDVTDSGSGIDPSILSSIFEPFFTTKAVGKGTGLGLASVYGAVRQSNGFIAVSSTVGEGTTFRIYLPRHVGTERVHRSGDMPVVEPPANAETILLVEDEASVLHVTAQALRTHGYRVLTALGHREALRVLERHEGSLALLLTDLVMPEMNGRDLAAEVRRRLPTIRVLYMSGYAGDDQSPVTEHTALDSAPLLEKPFSVSALLARVRDAIDGA
jgi:PAS domain S-box-containing protein